MAENSDQTVFFVDDDLVERLMRGDSDAAQGKAKRRAESPTLAKAVILASEGHVDDAIRALEGAAARGESPIEVHTGLGHLAFEQQNWTEAARNYAKATEIEPQNYTGHYNLGLCRLKLEQWDGARQSFEAALSGKGANQDKILFGKAIALHQLARLEEAAEIYRKLLAANPNSTELLSNLMAAALARKDENKAKELAERLLKIQPQSRHALEALASMALARGDYSGALQHCSQLVKVAADSYEGWFNLGVAYQKTGRLEQAANAFREAVRVRPEGVEANANLGSALQDRGDLPGARQAYERVLATSPDLPGVLWNLALVAEREGSAAEAEELFETLVAANPHWEDAAFRLGFLKLQRGDYAGAVDAFETCLKKKKDWI